MTKSWRSRKKSPIIQGVLLSLFLFRYEICAQHTTFVCILSFDRQNAFQHLCTHHFFNNNQQVWSAQGIHIFVLQPRAPVIGANTYMMFRCCAVRRISTVSELGAFSLRSFPRRVPLNIVFAHCKLKLFFIIENAEPGRALGKRLRWKREARSELLDGAILSNIHHGNISNTFELSIAVLPRVCNYWMTHRPLYFMMCRLAEGGAR